MAVLAICANVGFGTSVVAMNAYLPALASASPEVMPVRINFEALSSPSAHVRASEEETDSEQLSSDGNESATTPLLGTSASLKDNDEFNVALSRATSRISSLGIASGYGAGIILLLLALIPVTKLHGSTFSIRLAIGLSGVWWAAFSIPAALWLPRSTGTAAAHVDDASHPGSASIKEDDQDWTVLGEVVAAWKGLGDMLRWSQIKRLQHTFRYLAAWFLLSDGQSSHSFLFILPFLSMSTNEYMHVK